MSKQDKASDRREALEKTSTKMDMGEKQHMEKLEKFKNEQARPRKKTTSEKTNRKHVSGQGRRVIERTCYEDCGSAFEECIQAGQHHSWNFREEIKAWKLEAVSRSLRQRWAGGAAWTENNRREIYYRRGGKNSSQ